MAELKNHTIEGDATTGSFGTAGFLFTIPANALAPAQATFRHTGTAGFWYVMFLRVSGPTTSNYSRKLGAGETFTETQPPKGDVWVLCDGSADGPLHYYASWKS